MNLSSGTKDVLEEGKHPNTKCDFGSLVGGVIQLFDLKDLKKKGIGKKFHFVLGTAFGAKQFNGVWSFGIPGINAV